MSELSNTDLNPPVQQEESLADLSQTLISTKILHALKICPYLTQSSLQVLIGPALSAALWIPHLEDLVKEGKINTFAFHTKTPSGRNNTYTLYCLAHLDESSHLEHIQAN